MKPPYPGEDPRVWEPAEGAGIPENPHGRRILVVEDDPPIREVLVTTLRLSGYRVASAADGHHALETARACKPELVLMDLMLPGVDGWALTSQIRDDPDLGSPPVIVLSARVREADRQRAFDAGAVHFLPKPCRAGDLLEVIRTFLNDADGASTDDLHDVTADELDPDGDSDSSGVSSGSLEIVVEEG